MDCQDRFGDKNPGPEQRRGFIDRLRCVLNILLILVITVGFFLVGHFERKIRDYLGRMFTTRLSIDQLYLVHHAQIQQNLPLESSSSSSCSSDCSWVLTSNDPSDQLPTTDTSDNQGSWSLTEKDQPEQLPTSDTSVESLNQDSTEKISKKRLKFSQLGIPSTGQCTSADQQETLESSDSDSKSLTEMDHKSLDCKPSRLVTTGQRSQPKSLSDGESDQDQIMTETLINRSRSFSDSEVNTSDLSFLSPMPEVSFMSSGQDDQVSVGLAENSRADQLQSSDSDLESPHPESTAEVSDDHSKSSECEIPHDGHSTSTDQRESSVCLDSSREPLVEVDQKSESSDCDADQSMTTGQRSQLRSLSEGESGQDLSMAETSGNRSRSFSDSEANTSDLSFLSPMSEVPLESRLESQSGPNEE